MIWASIAFKDLIKEPVVREADMPPSVMHLHGVCEADMPPSVMHMYGVCEADMPPSIMHMQFY